VRLRQRPALDRRVIRPLAPDARGLGDLPAQGRKRHACEGDRRGRYRGYPPQRPGDRCPPHQRRRHRYLRRRPGNQAKKVVITLPQNVLHKLDVQPALSDGKLAPSREKTASQGVKAWIRVKGPIKPFFAYSAQDKPLSVIRTEFVSDTDAVLVGFGADANRIDVTDIEQVQEAIRVWRDDLEVLEVTGHKWGDGPLRGETWQIQRPGQLTKYHAAQQASEGALHFASGDIANIWAGFFDGAIESGLRAGRNVHAELKGKAMTATNTRTRDIDSTPTAVMRHLPTGVAAICSTDLLPAVQNGMIVGTFAHCPWSPRW
jgi:hypothetical protein